MNALIAGVAMIASWPTYTFLKPLPAASLMIIWAASLPKYLDTNTGTNSARSSSSSGVIEQQEGGMFAHSPPPSRQVLPSHDRHTQV
jgi:hypothetical protein